MANTIEETIIIPENIRELVGKEGGVGGIGWVILEIAGTGISYTYPTVRLLVSGNAVCAESFLRDRGLKASAINQNTVDIYLN